MGRVAHFKPGDHWVECPVCGFTYRNSEMRKRWDGQSVCKPDWEMRQPQDFVRAIEEDTVAKGHMRPPNDNILEIGDIGDENKTLVVGTDVSNQHFSTALTANRTITLSTTGASSGDRFTLFSKITHPFSIDIGPGILTINQREGFQVVFEFNGSVWTVLRKVIF